MYSYDEVLKRLLAVSRAIMKRYGFDSPEHVEFISRAKVAVRRVFGEAAATNFVELVTVFQLYHQLEQIGALPAGFDHGALSEKPSEDSDKGEG